MNVEPDTVPVAAIPDRVASDTPSPVLPLPSEDPPPLREEPQTPVAERASAAIESPSVAQSPPTLRRESPPPPPVVPAMLGATEFLALSADGYTIQLTSLANAALIGRYLDRHGLDPGWVYRVAVDEGAGLRWLLLWGAYSSVEGAEQARAALPESVRSPWARRIQPIQERLGR